MKIYKIKRLSDGKFYKGRSKFTKYGSYFRIDQIINNMNWAMSKSRDDKFKLIPFEIKEQPGIDMNENTDPEDIIEIMERNEKINQLLK